MILPGFKKGFFADLALRDFTINAMAVDFDQPDVVIDPLHGQKDLLEKRLRCCSAASFSRDPIRVIRAVRYSISCDVRIELETIRLLKESISGLAKVSWERKRDEFLKILDTGKPALGMELLWRLGICKNYWEGRLTCNSTICPGCCSEHSFNMIEGKQIGEVNRDLFSASINLRLGRFYPGLESYFTHRNSSDRNEKQITLLASLLKSIPINDQEKLIHSFLLSKEETNNISLLLSEMDRFSKISRDNQIDNRQIYLFYKDINEIGLDIILLGLAENLSHESELSARSMAGFVAAAEKLIEAWFERRDLVNPELLLNGKD
jgi:hypothetical protein